MDGDDKRLSENDLLWRKAVRTTKSLRRIIVDEITKDLDYFKESKIMANIARGPGTADEYWYSSGLLQDMGGETLMLGNNRDDLDNSPENVSKVDNLFNIQFEESLLDNRHLEVFPNLKKNFHLLLS